MTIMGAPRPRRLMADIDWDETSGVDHSANLEEGWMVMKNSGGGVVDLEDALVQEERQIQGESLLVKALESLDWRAANSEARQAAATLYNMSKAGAITDPDGPDDEPDNDPDDVPDGTPHTTVKSHKHMHDNGTIHTHGHDHEAGVSDHDTADHKEYHDNGAAPMGKASHPRLSSGKAGGKKFGATAVARVLGRSASRAKTISNVQKFDSDDAMMKVIALAWPDFCGEVAKAAKSSQPLPAKKAAVLKAYDGFISDVAQRYEIEEWSFGQEFLKRDYSKDERKKLAQKGLAIPDEQSGGSYPIVDEEDLKDAIKAFGHNPTPTVKSFIKKRARALGASDMLPDSWS